MSPPQQLRQQTSNCSSLLIYRPRKDERLSWPSWMTYSGWFTHLIEVDDVWFGSGCCCSVLSWWFCKWVITRSVQCQSVTRQWLRRQQEACVEVQRTAAEPPDQSRTDPPSQHTTEYVRDTHTTLLNMYETHTHTHTRHWQDTNRKPWDQSRTDPPSQHTTEYAWDTHMTLLNMYETHTHLKFALRPHRVWKYGRYPMCGGSD